MENVIIAVPSKDAGTLSHLFAWLTADTALRQAAKIVSRSDNAIELTFDDDAALPSLGPVLASWFASQSEPPEEISVTRANFTVNVFDADPEILDMVAELLDCPPGTFGDYPA